MALMEPDSEGYRAAWIHAKHDVGRFPAVAPGDEAEDYRRLWSWILLGAPVTTRQRLATQVLRRTNPERRARYISGGSSPLMSLAGTVADIPVDRRNPQLVDKALVVKSVHAGLAIDWLADEFDVDVLVVHRHPGAILASWKEVRSSKHMVRFSDNPRVQRLATSWDVRLPGPDPLEQKIWQIAVLGTALRKAAAHHPGWSVRTHEQLCTDPVAQFRQASTTSSGSSGVIAPCSSSGSATRPDRGTSRSGWRPRRRPGPRRTRPGRAVPGRRGSPTTAASNRTDRSKQSDRRRPGPPCRAAQRADPVVRTRWSRRAGHDRLSTGSGPSR